MALPPDASVWKKPLDPFDLDARQLTGRGSDPLLGETEEISTFDAAMSAEGAALGVQIESTGGYAPSKENGNQDLRIWFSVDPDFRENEAFSGAGIDVGVEVTIYTNSAPQRRLQRTGVLTVKQL